ncbi:DEAD-box ATP-dependent RNA helicase 38 [Aegilops tauschii subsp. strangulata]|nr:DEAD-box ATP-dependent RNA helicase 38 [Aegilops tauschii subsp. strangulata]XP_044376393.1 DEAD-box ATP-dependent RNA helicase 38-like [Triticum aestivum]
MAHAGAAKPDPEKKSWADVEEEEEAKAKAEAEAELAAAAASSCSSSSAPIEPVVEAQAKQIEALSLSVPDDDGGAEGPPLLDDSDDSQIQAVTSGGTVYESATTFEDVKLTPELLKGLHDEMGFSRPSKIQAITLPMILTPPYRDLVAQAHNGSGKTTCFVLGMLSRVDPNRKMPQAICICPTRELAQQNKSVLMRMGKFTGITCACATPPAQKDYMPISKMAPVTDQVVIGTSGTLTKWITHKKLATREIKILVFDEADHMLAEEGFKTDSLRIMKDIQNSAGGCQVLLFSATFNEKVKEFVTKAIKDGNQIFVKKEDLTLEKVKQYKVRVPDEAAKIEVIRDKIFEFGQKVGQVIIFVRTRNSTKNVHNALTKEDYVCSSIQGSLDQAEREKVIQEFKDGYTKVLISTDVLARGFDQAQVNLVINYDMPIKYNTRDEPDYEVYLHRIGRAGRFGRKGAVFNLLCGQTDEVVMTKIEDYFQHKVPEVPNWKSEDNFETALKDAGLLE